MMNDSDKRELGRFYGVGVGPGDVSMLTLRAAEVLRGVDVIFHATGRNSKVSVSGSVVDALEECNAEMEQLTFSMHRDQSVCADAWDKNAEKIAARLKQGENCAFATIGDPLLFSTYSYLLERVRRLLPEVEVETVPGITSFQVAASRTNQPLAENTDLLAIVPAADSITPEQESVLKAFDCSVLLKTYRHRNQILDRMADKSGNSEELDGFYAARLGMDGEVVTSNIREIKERPDEYLSMLILKNRKD